VRLYVPGNRQRYRSNR